MPQPAPAHASVDVTTIRDRFNFEWATSEPVDGVDTYWWWARSIRVDPNELIADDDEGNLWSVPFTTDGADAVTFGTPVRVRETYVPVGTGDGAAATAIVSRRRQRVIATALERPSKTNTNPAASERPDHQEESTVPTVTPDQLQRLRALPEDADQEQIEAALATETQPQPDPDPAPEPDPEPNPEPEPEPAPAAETVTVSAQVWEDTNERLARLEASATEREQRETGARRDALAAQWVTDGRITPAERTHYRQMLDVDEQRTTALATSLSPGKVPVSERGTAASTDDDAGAPSTTGWFPQLDRKES